MSRLIHSDRGYLRSIQISGIQVFAYVEGGLDRPFAERLINFVANGFKSRIIAAKELPGNTGGKQRLIAWFKALKTSGTLNAESWGKRFTSYFLLDKDADDFTNSKLRSPHVIYTTTYDLEGELYNCGDVNRALADAALITTQQSFALIPDSRAWLATVTLNWIDWTTLCLISQFEKAHCGCGFDRLSDINPDPLGPVDQSRLEHYLDQLRIRTNKGVDEFEKLYSRYRRRVFNAHSRGELLRYFKGKWLKHLIQAHCDRAPKIEDSNLRSIGDRIITALLAQVGANGCNCCSGFQERMTPAMAGF